MTPHDAWDYDGINESVLTDSVIDGQTIPTLTHFDRNGFAYVLDRRNGKLLKANKFDPSTNWAEKIDLKTGRPVLNPDKMTEGRCQRQRHLSGRAGRQESPARFLRSQEQTVLCRHQSHLHGLPGVQREVSRAASLMWAPRLSMFPADARRRARPADRVQSGDRRDEMDGQ